MYGFASLARSKQCNKEIYKILLLLVLSERKGYQIKIRKMREVPWSSCFSNFFQKSMLKFLILKNIWISPKHLRKFVLMWLYYFNKKLFSLILAISICLFFSLYVYMWNVCVFKYICILYIKYVCIDGYSIDYIWYICIACILEIYTIYN